MDVRSPHARVQVGTALLAIVWALSFAVPVLPFFPTVLVGGAIAGALGLWVRATIVSRRPPFTTTPTWVVVGLVTAGVHYVVGVAAFRFVAARWDVFPGAAADIYGRTAEVPLAAALVMAGLVTAPLEEVFWRGAVQPVVTRADRSATRRIVGGAIAYAAFHLVTFQPALVAAALLGGLVWGWLLERSGSVAVPMVAHGAWTALMIAYPP
ncbi:MAG: CPBP family intramembrane metalloprotease [Actinobacteria bacterium]|nr:CPBP family intramembrane metalloprotease [Actinomycetota bacterium]